MTGCSTSNEVPESGVNWLCAVPEDTSTFHHASDVWVAPRHRAVCNEVFAGCQDTLLGKSTDRKPYRGGACRGLPEQVHATGRTAVYKCSRVGPRQYRETRGVHET